MSIGKNARLYLLAIVSALLLSASLPNEFFRWGSPLLGLVCLVPLFAALSGARSCRESARLTAVFGGVAHASGNYWLANFHDYAIWTIGATTVAYMLVYAVFGWYLGFCVRLGQTREVVLPGPRVDSRGSRNLAKGGRVPWTGSRRLPSCGPECAAGTSRGALESALRPVAVAAVWASFEYLKSVGFLGYPWGLVAYSVNTVLPAIQIADRFGLAGISFLVALANALVAETLAGGEGPAWLAARLRAFRAGRTAHASAATGADGEGRPEGNSGAEPSGRPGSLVLSPLVAGWLFFAILAAGTLAYGFATLAAPDLVEKRVNAVLVQQNQDSWAAGGEIPALRVSEELTRKGLAASAARPDLVIWSETTLMRPFLDFRKFYAGNPAGDPFVPFLAATGAPLFTGAPIVLNYDTGEATNSVVLLTPDGRQLASYAKIHPVPFAEAIPFWELGWFREFMQKTVGIESGWVMGTDYTVFEVPLAGTAPAGSAAVPCTSGNAPAGAAAAPAQVFRFGAPICFEDAFPDVCRRFVLGGADALVNLTNDSWSLTVSAEIQHFVVARLRTVENRTTLVRSTNGGFTCVVDPKGRIIASLPLFTADALATTIPVYARPSFTPSTVLGDWLPFVFMAAILACLVYDAAVNRRRVLRGRPTRR